MDEFVTMNEAAELLGVARQTIRRMIRDGRLTAFQSDRDRRETLLSRRAVEALAKPRPAKEDRVPSD